MRVVVALFCAVAAFYILAIGFGIANIERGLFMSFFAFVIAVLISCAALFLITIGLVNLIDPKIIKSMLRNR